MLVHTPACTAMHNPFPAHDRGISSARREARSADLELLVTERCDESELSAERLDVAVQDVQARQVTVLDLGDPAGADTHRVGDLALGQTLAPAHLRQTVGAHTRELDAKVTERTRELADAQQQLVRSDKLAAIGQLTASIAHEVNNPIAVIQGNLDLVRELLGSDARQGCMPEVRRIAERAKHADTTGTRHGTEPRDRRS